MAIPPEPLDELLAAAKAVVLAKVGEIVESGPQPPQKQKTHPSQVDVGNKKRAQKVKLVIERVLKGPSASEVTVEKPEGAYTLDANQSGVFFLSDGKIIGRYGPETYPLEKVESALKR